MSSTQQIDKPVVDTFVITPEQSAANAFAVGVNHLALGQVEAVFALIRGCAGGDVEALSAIDHEWEVLLHDTSGPVVVGDALKRLIQSFMKRYAAAGSISPSPPPVPPQHQVRRGAQEPQTPPTFDAAANVSLHGSFRVVSSSIAPCMESLVYAVANTPGVSNADTKVWWDDELVVLVNVLIHAAANIFHAASVSRGGNKEPQNIAALRNALLQAFDFVLEHDPAQFGDLSFATFVSIVEVFDDIWTTRAGKACHQQGEKDVGCAAVPPGHLVPVAAFDGLLRSIWSLIRCFFSQSSYAEFFSECAEGWVQNASPGTAASPLFVLRVLSIAADPPPDPEESRRAYQQRLELRQQRIEDSLKQLSSHDAPVTFTRASYLKATSNETRRNLSHTLAEQEAQERSRALSEQLIASSLFCQVYPTTCGAAGSSNQSFDETMLEVCCPRPELHRFAEAYANYLHDHVATASSSATLLRKGLVPLQDAAQLFEYTNSLMSRAINPERRDAFSYCLQNIVDFVVAPTAGASPQQQQVTAHQRHQSLFTSVRGFFQASPELEVLKPFVCLELYGRRVNRDRFRGAHQKLSLHDHELLLDVLMTKDGSGGASLVPVGHPCRPFVAGLRLCLNVALALEKQPGWTSEVPNHGHLLLMDLLDSRCNVVDYLLSRIVHPQGSESTVSLPQPQQGGIGSLLRNTAAVLAAGMNRSSEELCETLALSVGQQRLMLSAIAVIQWVAESSQPPSASDAAEQSDDSGSHTAKEEANDVPVAAADVIPSSGSLEELLKGFASTAGIVKQFVTDSFLVLLSEALVELVVSMTAQLYLIPHLDSAHQQSSSHMSSTVLPAGGQKNRGGSSSASIVSSLTTLTSPQRGGRLDGPMMPPQGKSTGSRTSSTIVSSADRKKSLQMFCSIVTVVTRHLNDFLSVDVQGLLQDVVFRASHAEHAQCPERALIDAATTSPAQRAAVTRYSTFAQSPYRFLLEASLNQNSSVRDMEDVLLHLFVLLSPAEDSPNANGDEAPEGGLHPTLLFAFVSARLRALRDGRLSLSSFLQHLDTLHELVQSVEASSAGEGSSGSGLRSPAAKHSGRLVPPQQHNQGLPRLRLEELWFHAPSAVEQLLEIDSGFVRSYQQSILRDEASFGSVADIRAVSKRFEEVMASLGVHAPSPQVTSGLCDPQRDQASFRRYMSAVDNIKCPAAAVQNYLRQLDRLSRVACSASATADDLMPLLGSLAAAIGTEGDSPSSVWNPVFRRTTSDPTPMTTPIQVVDMIERVKQLSDVIQQVAGLQAALPDLVCHGHEMLFEAIYSGKMRREDLNKLVGDEGEATGLSSHARFTRNLLLRITLTEHCLTIQNAERKADYTAAFQLNTASAVAALLNPAAATLFVFLYCSDDTIDAALAESHKWFRDCNASMWMVYWLEQQRSTMNVLGRVAPADFSAEDNTTVLSSVTKANYYFSPNAQFQAAAEVVSMLCSEESRNDAAIRTLCEDLPMELLLASLHHISDAGQALAVQCTLLDALLHQMTSLRAHQVLKFSGDVATAANAKSADIPDTWCHIVEEVLFSCIPVPTIASAFVGNLQPHHQGSVLAKHPVRTLLPLHAQRRVLQRVHRQVAVELHCDPEDEEHRQLSQAVAERLEQLSVFTSMQDSVKQLVPEDSSSAVLPSCVRLLLLDPIPVELVVNQASVTDEALRRTVHEAKGVSPRDGLIIRTKHLSLVRSNTTSEDAQALAIRALCDRYGELLLLTRDTSLAQNPGRHDLADFAFIKELSTLIRSELAISPRTAPALIQRLVDKLLATPVLSTALLFRLVRFVTESSMTKAIFDGHEKWVRVRTGLHALHALVSLDDTAAQAQAAARRSTVSGTSSTPSSAVNTPITPAGGTAHSRTASTTLPPSQTDDNPESTGVEQKLHELFGRSFLSQPLLVVENLLMMQRVSSAAAVLQTFKDPVLVKESDKLLLRYARMAVDMSRFASMDSQRFPYGKELTDESKTSQPPLCPPAIVGIVLDAADDEATLANKRKGFSFPNTPHLPLFRRLTELVSDSSLMVQCVGDFAIALFDSLYDFSDNHVVRALIIDTAENILTAISTSPGDHGSPDRSVMGKPASGSPNCPTEELRKLWHYLQISRHLVVCKWDAHPSREELESEEGVLELITNLLHHGHNNGAFSIAEACNLDLRVVHGLWASRTTHLLNLGLFEEAAHTLSTLPRERVQGILSSVLETVECTPIAVGFRAMYVSGSYKVKQLQPPAVDTPAAIAASVTTEVQSLMTQRRIGVRSLLSRFGSPGDVMAYCVRSLDFAQVFPIVVQLKKEDDAFIKDVFQPVEDMQVVDVFQKAMLQFEPTLERMRPLLLAICKYQESRQEYASLLCWQEFMCDYARAGQTAVLLATLPCGDEKASGYQQRVAYLTKAETFFIEAKFQPATKQSSPQYSEEGILLPTTRVDAQQLAQSLLQCRLQKDIWGLLHQHASSADLVRLSLYGHSEQQAKVMVELLLLGKHFFEVVLKSITHLQLDPQHVYAPACLQLLRNKKHDVIEQLAEYVKKTMLLGPGEKNAVLHEVFVGCFHEHEANRANKKSMKMCELAVDCMTTEGGWKAKVLMKLMRWPEALNEALGSKDKQVILQLYETVSAVSPQDEETTHVANATRQYLARNNFRM